MRKKSILVAHTSMEFIKKVSEFCKKSNLYELSKYVHDGEKLCNLESLNNYDVVIIKNALTYMSGIYCIEKLLQKTKRPGHIHVVIISSFINDFFVSKCNSIGVHYIKDTEFENGGIAGILYNIEINANIKNKTNFETQMEIIRFIKQVGLLKTYIGYRYFEYALNIMFEKSENIYKSMSDLYSIIANHFKVTISSVEKAMRSCIKTSLTQNDNFYARLLFGYTENNYPSTSIFLQVCLKTLKEEKNIIINNNLQKSKRKI